MMPAYSPAGFSASISAREYTLPAIVAFGWLTTRGQSKFVVTSTEEKVEVVEHRVCAQLFVCACVALSCRLCFESCVRVCVSYKRGVRVLRHGH